MHSASSPEWETESEGSDPQSPSDSKPGTPLARVDTLRSFVSPSSDAKSRAPQKPRTPKPTRGTRSPSSLSIRSTASVHPLLGLHPYSTTTTSTSPPINITSRLLPPLTATLEHQRHSTQLKQDPYYHEDQPTSINTHAPPTVSRTRTTSTSSALSSLAHIPTRPPSPYATYTPHAHLPHSSHSPLSTPPNPSHLISFFPPYNPLLSPESIHPLLPAPFLGNHLTVLARRAPVRESLERVRSAKASADAAANGG